MKFQQVSIGARFTFRGRSLTKTALKDCEDENHTANVVQYERAVESEMIDPDPTAAVRDLWRQKKVATMDATKGSLALVIPAHGVVIYKFTNAK